MYQFPIFVLQFSYELISFVEVPPSWDCLEKLISCNRLCPGEGPDREFGG